MSHPPSNWKNAKKLFRKIIDAAEREIIDAAER